MQVTSLEHLYGRPVYFRWGTLVRWSRNAANLTIAAFESPESVRVNKTLAYTSECAMPPTAKDIDVTNPNSTGPVLHPASVGAPGGQFRKAATGCAGSAGDGEWRAHGGRQRQARAVFGIDRRRCW